MQMLWAYGWAFVDPGQKLGYNIFVTLTGANTRHHTDARSGSLSAVHSQPCTLLWPESTPAGAARFVAGCIIALVIAGVETLSVLAMTMHWKGAFWQLMIDAPFEILGPIA